MRARKRSKPSHGGVVNFRRHGEPVFDPSAYASPGLRREKATQDDQRPVMRGKGRD